jgi:hypothetical protein
MSQPVVPPKRTLQQVYVERAQRLPVTTEAMSDFARFGQEQIMQGLGGQRVRFLDATPLQRAFFSDANVAIIQNGIRFHVYERSSRRHIVGKQNEQELRIVMEAMFVQYALHQPTRIPEQIEDLNRRVVEAVVPKILTEVESYIKYLEDASNPLTLMDRPLNVSSAGTKTLEWGRPSPFAAGPW